MDSELLFLLIILITVVLNIVKAVRKKRGESPAPASGSDAPEGKKESEWEKVLRELLGETETPEPAAVSEETEPEEVRSEHRYTPVEEQEGSIPYDDDTHSLTPPDYHSRVFNVEQATEGSPSMKYTESLTGEDYSGYYDFHDRFTPFDLRTAVVYNTILNRPYH